MRHYYVLIGLGLFCSTLQAGQDSVNNNAKSENSSAPGYAYIYNRGLQTVALGASVIFSNHGPLLNISHTENTSTITIKKKGIYTIQFCVSAAQLNQFALSVNNNIVSSTIYGSASPNQQNNGVAILALKAGDAITLVNHGSAGAVGLQTKAGGLQENINASILIMQIG